MASMVIIGPGSTQDRNPPPVATLNALKTALSGVFPNRNVIINGGGNNLIAAGGRAWTPASVATWIKEGNVWIDYCGWPMYRYHLADGTTVYAGSAGFDTFVSGPNLGYPNLAHCDFAVKLGTTLQWPFNFSGAASYPFSNGLKLSFAMDGMYINTGSFVGPSSKGIPGVGERYPLEAQGYAANFALQPGPPKGGFYFYAVFTPDGLITFVRNKPYSVPVDVYASFITSVARGQINGSTDIQYIPYKTIHPLFNPPKPQKIVATLGSNGKPQTYPGYHLVDGVWRPDTPTTKKHPVPTPKPSPTPRTTPPHSTPWYQDPALVRAAEVTSVAAGIGGIAWGTSAWLRRRRGS